jgi:phosphatidate cytidylyltransferase
MTSELRLRLISAGVMIAIAGGVLWIGGWVFSLFVGALGLILVGEYWGMVRRITRSHSQRILWGICGILYIALACIALVVLPPVTRVILVLGVIGVDSGAYFAGRAIGGPKIAPEISPSKTWAGLGGGILGTAIILVGALWLIAIFWPNSGKSYHVQPMYVPLLSVAWAIVLAAVLAIVAQAGDFLESWLKRRAGVKDSGALIPGHGGLLDRVDGLMAAAILAGFLNGAGWL